MSTLRHTATSFILTCFFAVQAAATPLCGTLTQCRESINEASADDGSAKQFLNSDSTIFVISGDQSGYSFLGGSASSPTLIGYCPDGSFHNDSLPPALADMLSALSHTIVENPSAARPRALKRPRHEIPPLVQTHWRQYTPYNRKCPNNSAVGCVAVAMGQIMNVYKYPDAGIGSVSYKNGSNTIKADMSQPFDWTHMLNDYDYTGNYTDEEADAVADLLFRVGASVKMDYGPESAAMDFYISKSLKNYFKYESEMKYLDKSMFTPEEWEQMMYDELAAGRPIAYGGVSNSNAHCFVIDGYRDGYFHINWGWGGGSDGYFLITDIPSYRYMQTATIGIHPHEALPPAPEYAPEDVNKDGDFTIDDITSLIQLYLNEQ